MDAGLLFGQKLPEQERMRRFFVRRTQVNILLDKEDEMRPRWQVMLKMFLREELSYEEIAVEFKTTKRAVESVFFRIKDKYG